MRNAVRHKSQQGFVLVLTLWILAAIAIAAAYFGERVQASLRLAAARQNLAEAQLALSNGRAEALYRLATAGFTSVGLGQPPDVIRLDDSPYAESGGVLQLQDSGGLLQINGLPDEFLTRFLATLDVPQEHRAPLVDAMRDFADVDDLRRLNGAESAQYRAIGRTDLPRNQPFQSSQELRDVLGWADQLELWRGAGVLDMVTVQGPIGINPNTAPWQVLTALDGVTPEIARTILERRVIQPITADWLDRMLGTRYDGIPSIVLRFPTGYIRLTQWVPGLPWGHRYNVELTPRGVRAPWKLSDFYRRERAPAQNPALPPESNPPANASDIPRLPARSALPASAPRLLAN